MPGNAGILLLAAGESSRMGQSKQLLSVGGEPLLRRIAKISLQSTSAGTCVVLGANWKDHATCLNDLPVETIINAEWFKGIGSSVKFGVSYIMQHYPEWHAILITVCDQPFLNTQHLNNLMHAYNQREGSIIGSHYNHTVGVPMLFDKKHFEELLLLDDTAGAKRMAKLHKEDIHPIPFPKGDIDLDTPDDYSRYSYD